jgi:hypothetical protein
MSKKIFVHQGLMLKNVLIRKNDVAKVHTSRNKRVKRIWGI